MATKFSVGRILTLWSALIIVTSATVRADEDGQLPSIADTTTSRDRAAEAQRLARQAAALARQAAALAAESQAEPAPVPRRETASPVRNSRRVAAQSAADPQISDIDDQSVTVGARASDWRSHRQPREVPARFNRDTLRAAIVDDVPTENIIDRELPSEGGLQLASGTVDDPNLLLANDQEPLPTPTANRRSNNGQDANNVSGPEASYNGSSDGSCNTGCDSGCCNAPCLFWVGGVEATFLHPSFKNNDATIEVTDTAAERDNFCSTNDNGLNGLSVSPRIWLGVEGCCWGADIKYWQMRAQDGGADASLNSLGQWSGADCGVPDIGNFSCNSLNLYAIDLELSRRFCLREDQMQLSVGVRHAEIRHESSIVVNSDLGDTNLIAYGRDDSFTQGTGLVFGWYGRRPIYPCSCINWYYNLHYSVLWGPTTTAAETAALIAVNDPGSAGSTNLARTHADDTLLIGEAQLGLEWDYPLRCLPANAFFRAGIEFQNWQGGRGSSAANSFAGTTTTENNVVTDRTEVNASAHTSEPSLDLFGFTLGTGLTW